MPDFGSYFRVVRDPLGTVTSADHMYCCAGEQILIIAAGPPPAIQHVASPLDICVCQGLKPSFSRVITWIWLFSFWRLLTCAAGDHGARVCYDDLEFVPAIIDYEESPAPVSSYSSQADAIGVKCLS